MKRLVVGVLLVTALAGLGWQVYRRIAAASGPGKPDRAAVPVPVEVQPVRRDTIRDIGVFTGSLVPQSQFVVAPRAGGWLKKLLVDIGDRVGRNDVIAVLDDEQFTRQVEQATAELQVAKANAENAAGVVNLARREYERVKALREKQIASAAELDTALAQYNTSQTQLKVAQAQVVQKEAALEAAKLQLSYTRVRAFWEAGDPNRVVGERFVDEGALVQMNQPIVSILENNPLVAVIYIIERDYPKIKIGQEAVVTTDAYPGQTFPGRIRRIAPLVKETSRQARVEIEVANPDHRLKPGMFVRARVEFATHENALLVPFAALVRRDGREGVFLVEAPAPAAQKGQTLQARFVPTTTGIVTAEVVEVVEPEMAGSVVTLGNHLLEDGSRILLPQPKTAAGEQQVASPAPAPPGGGR